MLFLQLLTKMWKFAIMFCLINLTNSASIKNTENFDKLELIKEDVLQVGNTVNQFVFDLLDDILDASLSEDGDEEKLKNNSIVKQREKRQTSTKITFDGNKELETLCKHFNHYHNCLPTIDKIDELRTQVRNLEKSIDLLNSQQLDENHSNRTENTTIIINNLNRAKQLLNMERLKCELLEKELIRQKNELSKLEKTFKEITGDNSTKNFSDSILGNNFTENIRSNSINNVKINELKQLLSDINNNDDNMIDSTEIQAKILELEKRLKRRRNDKLMKEIKQIEEQLKDVNNDDDNRFEKSLEKILIRPQTKTDDVKSLQDLEDAINRLRPKEDTNNQFQTMFNKFITRPTRQQDIRKIINYNGNNNNNNNRAGPNLIPYICVMDDGKNENVQQFYGPPPPPVQQISYPNSYDQYRDDVQNQIDNLQISINNLNKPEVVQNSNDRTIITNLELQINELRNMLNQTQNFRSKRSTDDNNVNDHPINEKDRKQILNDIQNKINKLKQELGIQQLQHQQQQQQRSSTNMPAVPYNPDDFLQNLFYNFQQNTEIKSSSGVTDIFTEIISKIIDKVLAAIPIIVRKLFNFSIEELTNYDNYNPANYEMIELFRNLGVFGYLPIILIRLLSGLGNFLNILRYNKFFRTLLLPIIILGTVSGSIIFLNWFLQTDDIQYNSYDKYDNSNNNYAAPTTYSKSYLN